MTFEQFDKIIEKAQKVVDLLVKAEAHAFILIAVGVWMKHTGQEDPGLLLAGLAIFKGNR